MATPDYDQLDDLGRRALESQDTCETLIEQIRTALTEVSYLERERRGREVGV